MQTAFKRMSTDCKFHTRWRRNFAQRLADSMDMERLGVKGVYLFGSVSAEAAGPESDIDLILHIEDDEAKRLRLLIWLDAWEAKACCVCRRQMGYEPYYMLDTHVVTDADIRRKTAFATILCSSYEPVECLRSIAAPQ